MAKPKRKDLPDLSDLARPDLQINVRVTPGASATRLSRDGDSLRVTVTAAPENGKANDAVQQLLARAMRVAPSQLTLLRGHGSRSKIFVYSGSSRS